MERIFEIVKIKQVITETEKERFVVRSPESAAEFVKEEIGDDDREVLLVLCLNTKNEVVAFHRAHVGALNASVVHPREIMKTLILNNAASFIMAHNHPSGNPQPSPEDIHVTKRFVEVSKIFGINFLDHIIVGHSRSVSLKEKGYI